MQWLFINWINLRKRESWWKYSPSVPEKLYPLWCFISLTIRNNTTWFRKYRLYLHNFIKRRHSLVCLGLLFNIMSVTFIHCHAVESDTHTSLHPTLLVSHILWSGKGETKKQRSSRVPAIPLVAQHWLDRACIFAPWSRL